MTQVAPGTLNVGLGIGYLHTDKETRNTIEGTIKWFDLEQRVGFTSTLKAAVGRLVNIRNKKRVIELLHTNCFLARVIRVCAICVSFTKSNDGPKGVIEL